MGILRLGLNAHLLWSVIDFPALPASNVPATYWVAVKELKLSYYNQGIYRV